MVFERNPHWWGTPPEIDRIVYKIVPEANTRLAMIRRRESDIISKPPVEAIPDLERDADLRVVKVDGVQLMTFEMLTDRSPSTMCACAALSPMPSIARPSSRDCSRVWPETTAPP
jgi:ABC-type transport system substrate-binding protein